MDSSSSPQENGMNWSPWTYKKHPKEASWKMDGDLSQNPTIFKRAPNDNTKTGILLSLKRYQLLGDHQSRQISFEALVEAPWVFLAKSLMSFLKNLGLITNSIPTNYFDLL